MTRQFSMLAIALCISAVTFVWALVAISQGKSRHFYTAGSLVSASGVISSAGALFYPGGFGASFTPLVSAVLCIAGLVILYRSDKKPGPGGAA